MRTKKSPTKTVKTAEPVVSYQKTRASLAERLVPILLVAVIGLSFVMGVLWQKVQGLEKGGSGANTATAQQQAQEEVQVSIDQIKDLFSKDIIKFGDASKKLLLVAIEDPSCPYCHIASGKNPELNKSAGGQFTLVKDGGTYIAPMDEIKKLVDSGKASLAYFYTNGHGNGEMGHKALVCAHEKGKFWAAHDLLYSSKGYDLLNNTVKNDKTKAGELAEFLKSAVPAADMKACLDSGKYDGRITAESSLATSLSVGGTPGFFVNATRFAGAYSYAEMEPVVKAALGQ